MQGDTGEKQVITILIPIISSSITLIIILYLSDSIRH